MTLGAYVALGFGNLGYHPHCHALKQHNPSGPALPLYIKPTPPKRRQSKLVTPPRKLFAKVYSKQALELRRHDK